MASDSDLHTWRVSSAAAAMLCCDSGKAAMADTGGMSTLLAIILRAFTLGPAPVQAESWLLAQTMLEAYKVKPYELHALEKSPLL